MMSFRLSSKSQWTILILLSLTVVPCFYAYLSAPLLSLFAACIYAIWSDADADADGAGDSIYPWTLRYIEKRGFCAFANRRFLPGTVVNKSNRCVSATSALAQITGQLLLFLCETSTTSSTSIRTFVHLSIPLPPYLPSYKATLYNNTIQHCTTLNIILILNVSVGSGDLLMTEAPTVTVKGHHPFTLHQKEEIDFNIEKLSTEDKNAFFDMSNVFPERWGNLL